LWQCEQKGYWASDEVFQSYQALERQEHRTGSGGWFLAQEALGLYVDGMKAVREILTTPLTVPVDLSSRITTYSV